MVQRLGRDGSSVEYDAAYAIGSGVHAVGYLIQIGDHLFQSPLCFYRDRGWDMAPGYEENRQPDFYRPVTPECLFCHAGEARPVPNTLNTYQTPIFKAETINCERCHGPAESHLRKPLPGSIINPANLPARARDSVCEQCHLTGETRVANPGKQLTDFHPGEDLEDVYTVYVFQASGDAVNSGRLKLISHPQQLALSTCAQRSGGKLWCGTCHDPHEQPANPKAYFRARCLSCHGDALLHSHPKPNDDCIGCHMPKRAVWDGGHTVFTDHRIARRPAAETALAGAERPKTLVAWHDPPDTLVQRNLGLAEIEVGEKLESFSLVSQGYQLLSACWPNFQFDPAVASSIGQFLLGTRLPENAGKAAEFYERAIQVEPNVASNYLHAAIALKAAHETHKSIEYLERALELDPLLDAPYHELATIYSDEDNAPMLSEIRQRFRKAFQRSQN